MRRFTFFYILEYPDNKSYDDIQADFAKIELPEEVAVLVETSGTAEHHPIVE